MSTSPATVGGYVLDQTLSTRRAASNAALAAALQQAYQRSWNYAQHITQHGVLNAWGSPAELCGYLRLLLETLEPDVAYSADDLAGATRTLKQLVAMCHAAQPYGEPPKSIWQRMWSAWEGRFAPTPYDYNSRAVSSGHATEHSQALSALYTALAVVQAYPTWPPNA